MHLFPQTRLFAAALLLLWLQLFCSLVPTWRFGNYYAYGWFVPFLAAGLAWRRWRMLESGRTATPIEDMRISRGWVALTALALLLIAPLRLVATADPTWRPPLLLHVIIVFGLTHVLLWKLLGARISLGIMPVTVFALSAVPYPWRFEQELIGKLTGLVVGFTHEIFLLSGKPVEMVGGQLSMGSELVEVSEGCTGIRSLQSLWMVALFFGELLLLPVMRRLALIAIAAVCAIGVNTMRACWLTEIHFEHGKAAAASAHDVIGHASFFLSAAILYLSALWMLRTRPAGRLVVRRSEALLH